MIEEKKEVLQSSFKNLETKYANQTLVQGTDMDMAIGFGIVGPNQEGIDIADYHTMVRMSYPQFKALVEHCNNILEQMENSKIIDAK